jgi:hypothetical protein
MPRAGPVNIFGQIGDAKSPRCVATSTMVDRQEAIAYANRVHASTAHGIACPIGVGMCPSHRRGLTGNGLKRYAGGIWISLGFGSPMCNM